MPRRSARPQPDRTLELATSTRDCPACGHVLWAANKPQRTVVTPEGPSGSNSRSAVAATAGNIPGSRTRPRHSGRSPPGPRIVVVLGHPEFYLRFGFSAKLAERLKSPFSGSAFMALELVPGALDGVEGEVRYPPPFTRL